MSVVVQCREQPAVRDDSSSTSAILKQLDKCPACAHQPDLIPVLDPSIDPVPFAMSLEICQATTPPATTGSLASPICELFYFLQGSGSVSVHTPNSPPWEKKVGAGVENPCQCIHTAKLM